MYDLAILGGGPAAMTAALYAARKILNTLLLAKEIGGQMMLTTEIENYIGFQQITGAELTGRFYKHMSHFEGVEKRIGESVTGIRVLEKVFEVSTNTNGLYQARTVIIATGKRSRPLGVPGEKELAGRGISYCSTCDAPLFGGREVAVIGGGNSAVQAAIDLLPIATEISIVNFAPNWQADPILLERIENSKKVVSYLGWEVLKVLGEKRVSGIVIRNRESGEVKELPVEGIFAEIGLIPNSEFAKGVVDLNKNGEIVVDCYCRTSVPGIFAAGDVTTVPAKQIIVACGEGAKAALSAYDYLIMDGFWTKASCTY